jgi:hypothetical protein
MGLLKKKRTLGSELACLFHSEADPAWFTKENADHIPTCTTCHIHLVPETFKEVLVSGDLPPDLELDRPAALSAACAGMTILWSHLNTIRPVILAKQVAQGDVWGAVSYPSWPATLQGELLANIGDAVFLEASELGSLTEFFPYFALTHSNFLWKLEESQDQVEVHLWPKEVLAVLSAHNFQALRGYLEKSRELLPEQSIWLLLDRLIELVHQAQPNFESRSLFGVEVSVETLMSQDIQGDWELEENELFESQELLNLEVGASINPLGPDSPKRLYPKLCPGPEMIGPFDLSVSISQASSDSNLILVHTYTFKLLVSASDSEAAVSEVQRNFFRKFGFTKMQRENQNWRVDDEDGVDWDLYDRLEDPWLNSKITDIKTSEAKDWSGTAWQSRCL